MKEREYGSSGNYGPYSQNGYGPFRGFYGEYRQTGNAGNAGQESEQDLHLRAAANFINNGRYQEAMNVLNGINEHTAQWYYYSAIANSGLGNNATALQHAKEALRMEPANYQYQMLVNQFESGGSWYRQTPESVYHHLRRRKRLVCKIMYCQHRLQLMLQRRNVLRCPGRLQWRPLYVNHEISTGYRCTVNCHHQQTQKRRNSYVGLSCFISKRIGNTKKIAASIFSRLPGNSKDLIDIDTDKTIPEANVYFIGSACTEEAAAWKSVTS